MGIGVEILEDVKPWLESLHGQTRREFLTSNSTLIFLVLLIAAGIYYGRSYLMAMPR